MLMAKHGIVAASNARFLTNRHRWSLTRGLNYSDLTKRTKIFDIMDIKK